VKDEGVFKTMHPKYNSASNIEKEDEQHYILRVKGVETSKAAQRCFGNIEYSANFTSTEGYLLEVYHNETKITEKQMPEAVNGGQEGSETDSESQEPETGQNETEQESKGFFTRILNSLGSIF
jgi:hypothetical protein